MANAKCCDRCGAFYKYVDDGELKGLVLWDMAATDARRMTRGREVDLCPECQKILDGFMKMDMHATAENDDLGCKTCALGPVPCCHTCRSEAECPHK